MSELSHVGVGIIGLGFMGATHYRAYQSAHEAGFQCKVVAVSDRSPERLGGRVDVLGNIETGHGERLFDPTQVRTSKEPRELLSDHRVHLVSICTHTETHVDLAIAALEAGKHVLVEKPVALASGDVRRLAAAVKQSGKLCMPAMCMRFWPGWSWLRERIVDGRYGKVSSATFERLGSAPTWATDFYADVNRSGGSLFDLHIHDADFILWCFGRPREVVSVGSIMHMTTMYRYDPERGPAHVVAEGGQDHAPGFGFRMRYTVAFERATADFDLARTPHLLVHQDGKSVPVELPKGAGYDGQIRHIVDSILGGRDPETLIATIEQAAGVTELLEAERTSIETRSPVQLR